jgi:putative membrane protein
MNPFLAAIDYQIFPPINATLNSISTVLLIIGFLLIKSGRKDAHRRVMIGALVSSALFLACYLVYHYGAGSVKFPKEYPMARRIYLAILIPHIILAVVNLPFIILLVIAAARGRFETHKKIARLTFPSWLFVSFTGVIIYLMLYQWFLPTGANAESGAPAPSALPGGKAGVEIIEARIKSGDIVFTPASQMIRASAGQKEVEVTFSVENTASVPIGIARLESGCACLSVTIDEDPIPPRSSATITGIFDTEQLRGASEKQITIVSDQQDKPTFLTTRIEVEPIYSIEESMTTWSLGSKAETKVVTFRVLREEPLHVLSAESKRAEVRCELVEVEKGRLYQLKLTPNSTDASLLGIVRMETDCEIEAYARPLAYFSIQ